MATVCSEASLDIVRQIEVGLAGFERQVRDAAERAFALANYWHEHGDDVKAKAFGLRSIALFEVCDSSTQTRCGRVNKDVLGFEIPEIVHDGVVRGQMAHWGIRL
jgi:hypothetical protein